jgi:hypothetical protein
MDNVPLGADPLLSVIYRKSKDPYLCNCEATVSSGRKVFEVYCDNSHAGCAWSLKEV